MAGGLGGAGGGAAAGGGGAIGGLKALAVTGAATVAATAMIMFTTMGGDGGTQVALAEDDCGRPGGAGSSTPTQTYGSNDPSGEANSDIPADYLEAYRAAGEEYGLDWTYIAAIGKIETDHGRYNPSGGGCISGPETPYGAAQGPMQFIPSTWDTVGVDGDGDGTADPCNFRDAIAGAANYLKQSGAPGDWYGAIYAYNHADWYVQDVMAQADAYRSAEPNGGGPQAAIEGVGEAAETALAALPPAHLASLADTLRASGASALGTQSAAAETLDWNLVGDDKSLSYEEYTAYDSALSHGVGAWNNVGIISVEPSGGGGTDVEIGDTNIQESILGRTSSDGTLVFNVPNMDDATQNAQNSTASHELGHAMGLAHTTNPSVMNTPIMSDQSDNYDSPTDFDVQELSGLWGSPSPDDGGGGSGDEQYDDGGGQNPDDGGGGIPEGPQSPPDGGGGETPDGGGAPEGPQPPPDGGGDEDDGDTSREEFFGGLFGDGNGGGGSEDPPNGFGSSGNGDRIVQIDRNNGDGDDGGGGGRGGDEDEDDGGRARDRMEQGLFPFIQGDPDDDSDNDGDEGGGGSRKDGDGGGGGSRKDGDGGGDAAKEQYDGGQYGGGQYGDGGPSGGGPSGGGGEPISCPDPGPGQGGGSDLPNDGGPSGGGENPSGGGAENPSGDGNAVVAEAEKYLGVPFVLGGPEVCKPGEIMDCTCLTTTVYREFGFELTDSPGGQMGYGEPVQGELQPGDITFYAEHGDGIISHVAISMGGNKIIHASEYLGETGYTEDHNYLQGYVGARRLLN